MGIFFPSGGYGLSQPKGSGVVLSPATPQKPAAVKQAPGLRAAKGTSGVVSPKIPSKEKQKPFFWGRLIFATLLLAAILGTGVYTSMNNMEDWSKMLVHSFELVLGLILGILGGEAAQRA